jgi:hypothetical protein
MKLNDTTRTYPRSMSEAFPDSSTKIEIDEDNDLLAESELCVYITLAFALGFLTCYLFV